MERAVCIRVTCCSSERTPRTFVDITDPIATMETATTASAINTSMIVKPASRRSIGGGVARNNFNPSGQPVDANLVANIKSRQRDGPATRHSAGKETDGRQDFMPVAGLRQQRIETDILRNSDHVGGRARPYRAACRIDQRGDVHATPDC